MTAPVRCAALFAGLLAAPLTAGAAAASEPAALPPTAIGIAHAAAEADAGAGAMPDSRLLRMLSEGAAPPAPEPAAPEALVGEPDPVGAGLPASGGAAPAAVLQGCPRALLAALLAEATETADAVSALAIERETLALCRERQEIVNGIVALEGELGELLAEARGSAARPTGGQVGSTIADTPTVKESVPVRVISLPPADEAAEEAPDKDEAPADPAPPDYAWFSIIGTAGDLRAGIGDGTGHGGARVWFVREGDSLPGGVTVARIVARPPGVHVEGAVEGALPYRPRPFAVTGPRRDGKGDGS